MLTPLLLKSAPALSIHPLASHLQSHSTSAFHHHRNDVDPVAERWLPHSLERHDLFAISVTLAATDEELQKMGKPPINSGQEDEYVSLLSTRVPALLAGPEDPARIDMSMTRIRATHRRGPGGNQETLPRLRDEREGTSVGSDQRQNHSAPSAKSPLPQCQ